MIAMAEHEPLRTVPRLYRSSAVDEAKVQKVHFKHGYYLDKRLFKEANQFDSYVPAFSHLRTLTISPDTA